MLPNNQNATAGFIQLNELVSTKVRSHINDAVNAHEKAFR